MRQTFPARDRLARLGLYFKGGSGNTDIKDTEDQKALAQIANERWQRYKTTYRPIEDKTLEDIQQINNAQHMQQATQAAQAATRSSFGQAIATDLGQRMASGVNPNSGAFNAAIDTDNRRMAQAESDTVNKTQQSLDDQKVAGLQTAINMGSGQATEALAGLSNVASASAQNAADKAINVHNDESANKYLASQAAGAGARVAINGWGQ